MCNSAGKLFFSPQFYFLGFFLYIRNTYFQEYLFGFSIHFYYLPAVWQVKADLGTLLHLKCRIYFTIIHNTHQITPRSSRSQMVCNSDQVCNFIKKRLQHRRFPVNIAKFLWTALFIEHLWLLPLYSI